MFNMIVHGGFLKGYKNIIGVAMLVLSVVLPYAYGDIDLQALFSGDNLKTLGEAFAAWGIGSKLTGIFGGAKPAA